MHLLHLPVDHRFMLFYYHWAGLTTTKTKEIHLEKWSFLMFQRYSSCLVRFWSRWLISVLHTWLGQENKVLYNGVKSSQDWLLKMHFYLKKEQILALQPYISTTRTFVGVSFVFACETWRKQLPCWSVVVLHATTAGACEKLPGRPHWKQRPHGPGSTFRSEWTSSTGPDWRQLIQESNQVSLNWSQRGFRCF